MLTTSQSAIAKALSIIKLLRLGVRMAITESQRKKKSREIKLSDSAIRCYVQANVHHKIR